VSGYAGGNWTGNGITSSAAAADPTGHAVGYAEASEVGSPSSFLGQSVDATAVLVRYTRVGDADLNGTTDLVDFGRLAINFNNAGQWVTGDFNFDGNTNLNDFSLLALNFNQSALGSLPRGTAVPEAGVGLMGLIGTAVLARRRRG
ncbi:MAG: hypothetical protein NZ561_05895, partial [Phycisphaerae bacterium]|nr:hypothetical protein [Phycisphaerae bacterium]